MGFLFILKRIGFFVFDNWKVVLPVIGALILIVFLFKACNRPPKLDEKAIQKAQQAIATQDREAMTKVLAEIETAEKQIDANAADAQAQTFTAIQNAKQKAAGLTNEQLAKRLEELINQ